MSNLRFVGLDVHKETIVVAVADEGREGPEVVGTIQHDLVLTYPTELASRAA